MVDGIKDCHITKFSRLCQKMNSLMKDIKEYCPNATMFVENGDTFCLFGESAEFGVEGSSMVISEYIQGCECGSDVGTDVFDEDAEFRLRYYKKSRRKKNHSLSWYGLGKDW